MYCAGTKTDNHNAFVSKNDCAKNGRFEELPIVVSKALLRFKHCAFFCIVKCLKSKYVRLTHS